MSVSQNHHVVELDHVSLCERSQKRNGLGGRAERPFRPTCTQSRGPAASVCQLSTYKIRLVDGSTNTFRLAANESNFTVACCEGASVTGSKVAIGHVDGNEQVAPIRDVA